MDTFGNKIKTNKNFISERQAKDSGMALVLIGLLLLLFLKDITYLYIAIGLHIINMIWPVLFKPFAKVWFGLSHLLGTVMSKLILTIVFYIVVFPMGRVLKLTGKDSLKMKAFKKSTTSVFTDRSHTYTKEDLAKPY